MLWARRCTSTHNIYFRGEVRNKVCGYPLLSGVVNLPFINRSFSPKHSLTLSTHWGNSADDKLILFFFFFFFFFFFYFSRKTRYAKSLEGDNLNEMSNLIFWGK